MSVDTLTQNCLYFDVSLIVHESSLSSFNFPFYARRHPRLVGGMSTHSMFGQRFIEHTHDIVLAIGGSEGGGGY